MEKIDPLLAQQALDRERERQLAGVGGLRPWRRRAFVDPVEPDRVMLVQDGVVPLPEVRFSGYREGFYIDCIQWLQSNLQEFEIRGTDRRVTSHPRLMQFFDLSRSRCVRDFVCTSVESVPPVTVPVMKLSEDDKPAVLRYPEDETGLGQTLAGSFENCFVKGRGEIFAAKEDGEILGYLYCHSCYWSNGWGIYMIHVRQDYRRQGIASQLAAAYAREKLAQGDIPFYDGAQNNASARTALAAGFHCFTENFIAEARRRT